jgi:hypothetical protein
MAFHDLPERLREQCVLSENRGGSQQEEIEIWRMISEQRGFDIPDDTPSNPIFATIPPQIVSEHIRYLKSIVPLNFDCPDTLLLNFGFQNYDVIICNSSHSDAPCSAFHLVLLPV